MVEDVNLIMITQRSGKKEPKPMEKSYLYVLLFFKKWCHS